MCELISVIVPVYNIKDLLPNCLTSIANQSYRNLEIILVDDGSDDGSEQLCDNFAKTDSRARVIHKRHQGPWAARNVGQEAATGEYLFFPDGDDYFHREMISLLYSAINWQGKDYPLALCNIKRTNSLMEDTSSPVVLSITQLSRDNLMQGLVEHDDLCLAVHWNKLYRKTRLFSPLDQRFPRAHDIDSNLRFYLQINNAVLVDCVLYYYYQHSTQITKVTNYWAIRHKCEIQIFTRVFEELSSENRKYEHLLLTRLYKRMIEYKASSYNTERYSDVLELCKESEIKTLSSFLSCCHIPFFKRYLFVFLLRHSRFTHLLMRLTKNI
jgi:glycosyltransferase involved in cell wall biosynthesis